MTDGAKPVPVPDETSAGYWSAAARGVLALREAGMPLQELVWSFRPQRYEAPRTTGDWLPQTPESKELSKRLKRAGFRFVGPTTVYSSLEACGIVNGHIAECWVRDAVEAERAAVR